MTYDDWKGMSDRDDAGPQGEPCEDCGLECSAPQRCFCCDMCAIETTERNREEE